MIQQAAKGQERRGRTKEEEKNANIFIILNNVQIIRQKTIAYSRVF